MKNQEINIKYQQVKVKERAPKIEYTSGDLKLTVEAVTFKENERTSYNQYYDRWSGWTAVPNPFYTVALVNGEIKETFDFTDSINAFVTGKLSQGREIFHCLVNDYLDFMNVADYDELEGVQNVMNEFGYESVKEAAKVYRGLHQNHLKMERLGMTEEKALQWLEENQDL